MKKKKKKKKKSYFVLMFLEGNRRGWPEMPPGSLNTQSVYGHPQNLAFQWARRKLIEALLLVRVRRPFPWLSCWPL